MTNLRLFQTERVCRRQFSILRKMAESSPYQQKTLWEKEKLLLTSNFSFYHSVFKRFLLQTRKNQGLFGKGLTYCSNTMLFVPCNIPFLNSFPNSTSLLKTLWKNEKSLVTSNSSFSQCFLPFRKTLYHFLQFRNCRLQTPIVWECLQVCCLGKRYEKQ